MSFFKEFLSKFPSSFTTVEDSNNWKLTKFFTDKLDIIRADLQKIDKYRNVDYAEGKALDNLGLKYGVQRGQADDNFYRAKIRGKIATRKGDATINGILNSMKNSLYVDIKGVKIDYFDLDGQRVPLAIKISNVPLKFAHSKEEQKFMLDQIRSAIAVGIRLQELEFETGEAKVPLYLGVVSIANSYVQSPVNYQQLDLRPIVRENLYVAFGHNQIIDTSVQADTEQFKNSK